jgi:hypothetical protein
MPPTTADITTIEAWFRESFPEHTVASQVVGSREVVLFRVHEEEPGAPRFELEVSYEAFEEHGADAIATDLTAKRVADRLRQDPAVRLMYHRRQALVETDRHS